MPDAIDEILARAAEIDPGAWLPLVGGETASIERHLRDRRERSIGQATLDYIDGAKSAISAMPAAVYWRSRDRGCPVTAAGEKAPQRPPERVQRDVDAVTGIGCGGAVVAADTFADRGWIGGGP
jgi:hypothetical protein